MTSFLRAARLLLAAAPVALAAAASAGTLTPVAPYADPYYTETTLLGINNAGYTTGNVYHDNGDGSSNALGFVRAPDGTYTTFSNTAYGVADFTSGRAISNNNTVIGYSSINGGASTDLRGFQRLADGTVSLLARPSDGLALAGIAQGINESGTIVGNFRSRVGGVGPFRNHAYLLNGASFTDLIDPALPFASTNARGIANDGTVVGWTSDGVTGTRGWIYSGGGFQYLSHPDDLDPDGLHSTVLEAINNVGQMLGGYTSYSADGATAYAKAFMYDPITGTFTDITIPGALSVTTWGINDSGSYVVTSDAGNFIYDPAGPTAPDGSPVFAPVDGADVPPGTSQFQIVVVEGQVYYIDPAFASGFEYLAGTGPLFSSVIAPAGIGVNNGFSLYLWNGTDYVFDQTVFGGVEFDFLNPVDRFQLRGIPASAAIDPLSPEGFVTGLTFASAGEFDGFQIALTAVPEPATWALMIAGFGFTGISLRRRTRVLA